MDTITATITNRSALVQVTGSPAITGRDMRGRDALVTIIPARIQFREGLPDYADPGEALPRRTATVTGFFVRDVVHGQVVQSGYFRSIEVDLTDPETPDWLLGLAALHLPEGDLTRYGA